METPSVKYVVRGRIVEWDATRVRHVGDVFAAWDAINADGAVVPGCGLLIDNGESSFDVPGGDVKRLADAIRQRLPNIAAVAILVSRAVHYGMARQFQAYADNSAAKVQIQVFRDITSAQQWLTERTASAPTQPIV
jgi:hypothetical protein